MQFTCTSQLNSLISYVLYLLSMVRQPSDLLTPIGAKEGLDCVGGPTRLTLGIQSHRTQGHRCQDLGKELQSCYCWSKRNLEQTNDKEFQPSLYIQLELL